jgi:hypothetical protein
MILSLASESLELRAIIFLGIFVVRAANKYHEDTKKH